MHGLDPEKIICGVGSDEVINWLCQAYAGPGDEVIHTEHGFSMYRISALGAGATPVVAAERDRTTDVDDRSLPPVPTAPGWSSLPTRTTPRER